ncbi:VCBS repeat-containing protein, partial [bacterium]|nr:VCBS repeat-containing protein [bacterium]
AVSGYDGGLNERLIIYRNNGDGSFTNAAEPMGAGAGVASGSIQWGDYYNDGDLDLAVSGYDGTNARLVVYQNSGGSFTTASQPMGAGAGVYNSSVQWGDYDNDGDLDLAISGIDGVANRRLIIYRNNGGGSFTNAAEPMGVNAGIDASSIQWGDYDNDGDLDLAASGSLDGGTNKRLILYRNDAIAPTNVRPAAPSANAPKGASFAQGDTVVFRWSKVTGDTTPDTGITYNLRVGSAPGKVDVFAADTNSADSVGNTILGNVQNDTSAALVRTLPVGTYYWSVQAVDGGMMRSAWAPEETFAVTPSPNTSGKWYVNDASTTGDSFTTAAGSDNLLTNNGGASLPYATITKALSQSKSGDTIFIDAGLYSETVVIDTDYISLIGKDSGATVIDPPGANSTIGLYGIYADTQTGLTIKSLGVTGAYDGIHLVNVSGSKVESDSITKNGRYGVYLLSGSNNDTISGNNAGDNWYSGIVIAGSNVSVTNNTVNGSANGSGIVLGASSSNNTIANNTAIGNWANGIEVNTSAANNTVTGNVANSNNGYGIYLFACSNNFVSNNTATFNNVYGIFIGNSSSSKNVVFANRVSNNIQAGIVVTGDTHSIFQNEITANDTGVLIYGFNNSITKNNIVGNSVNNLRNSLLGSVQTLTSNWFGSTDETKIGAGFSDTASTFRPYRLGPVDTAAGADTTAPAAPGGVTLNAATPGQITVSWTNPTTNEETNGGAVGFAGVKIYRLRNTPDTTHWANVLAFTTSGASWVDTGANDGAAYYYRLSSFDGSSFVNQSWFTDTVFATSIANSPETISIVSGNHGLGAPGAGLPIRVRVVNLAGGPMSSETVTFSITHPTGAALSASGARLGDTAGVTSMTALTDASGYVSETVGVGTTGDVFRVQATIARATSKYVAFTAYADGRDIADSTWRMMAPNKKMLATDPATVVGADMGGAGQYKLYEWREDKGVNSSISGVTTKFHEPTAIERGRGFWAKQISGAAKRWVIDEGAHGSAGFDTVNIPLRLGDNGWNQIGSGQYFYVDWQKSVKVDTGLGITDTPTATHLLNMISMDSAHAGGVLSKILYWYDGSQYQWGPNTLAAPGGANTSGTSTVPGVQMKPMVGFWVKALVSCTLWVFPDPAEVAETASVILQQAPGYLDETERRRNGETEKPLLSAYYKEQNRTGTENDWAIQIMASGGGKTDAQNYVGVMPSPQAAALAAVYEPPAAAGGYVAVAVRKQASPLPASPSRGEENSWLAAHFAEPIGGAALGRAWDVLVAADVGDPVTLAWDNVSNLPHGYEAYLIGAPQGPVNLRKIESLPLSLSPSLPFSLPLTLAVGLPDYLAPFLAAPLSKENTFIYPNPGPDDATGSMTFKYNLPSAADVSLKIFDMGGKLVKELKGSGVAGSNTLTWDTTNKHGQKLGSGVYIYKLESGGTTLVDKLAIVR